MVENLFRLLAIFPDLCENPLIQEMLGLFSYRAIYGPNHYAHLFHTEFSAILLEITESPEISVNWNRGKNHLTSRLMLTEKENWIGVVGDFRKRIACNSTVDSSELHYHYWLFLDFLRRGWLTTTSTCPLTFIICTLFWAIIIVIQIDMLFLIKISIK